MLTTTDQLSDYISNLYASIGINNSISAEELFLLQSVPQTFGIASPEYKAARRVLRAVRRGQVTVVSNYIAS